MIIDLTQTAIEKQLVRPQLRDITLYHHLLRQLHDLGCITTQTLLNETGLTAGGEQ